MRKIGVMSDTHSWLDKKVKEHFADVDEIWHAGDIGKIDVMDQLEEFKPIRGVYGNIDDVTVRTVYPLNQRFKVEGMKILMTHIAGRPGRYPERVKELIKEDPPDIFVCGHSHILRVMWEKKFKHLHINPGACGNHGIHKVKTLITFVIDGDKAKDMKIVEIER